mgnify:FL=1
MGGRLARRPARQHPHLSAPVDDRPATRAALLVLLAVDGVLSAVLAAFFLPLRIGLVPFPVSALISGALNAALVWVGLQWFGDRSRAAAATPLWTWLACVAVFTVGGPGGDVVFGTNGLGQYALLVLLALGAGPPVAVLARHRR